LAALAPDVIVGNGSAAVGPLLQATCALPTVFATVPDPVGAGFVDSLARPGGNATALYQFEYGIGAKWLELLKEIALGSGGFRAPVSPAAPRLVGFAVFVGFGFPVPGRRRECRSAYSAKATMPAISTLHDLARQQGRFDICDSSLPRFDCYEGTMARSVRRPFSPRLLDNKAGGGSLITSGHTNTSTATSMMPR
jgi:hypothetical protein